MTLLIRESYVNETAGYRFGDSEWFESFTDNRGKLFRDLQREYGQCTSKVYREFQGADQPVGWVFSKRVLYEDARRDDNGKYREDQYYVRTVWVELRTIPLCVDCGKDEAAHHVFRTNGSGKECSPDCAGAA